jgi:hypothetical protein
MFLETRAYCPDILKIKELLRLIRTAEGTDTYSSDDTMQFLERLRTDWSRKLPYQHNYQNWAIIWKHIDSYYFSRRLKVYLKRLQIL